MRGPPTRALARSRGMLSAAAAMPAARCCPHCPAAPSPRATTFSTLSPPLRTALPARRPTTAAAAAADAPPSDADLLAAFDAAWDAHVAALRDQGHWRDVGPDGAPLSAAGALKHAHLEFARARPDVLHSLPREPLAALLAAPLPHVDRKTGNAAARLAASVVEGAPLGVGVGGAASTADVVRLLLAAKFGAAAQRARAVALASSVAPGEGEGGEEAAAAAGASAENDDLLAGDAVLSSPRFVAAALELLPTIGALMAADPDPEATAAAAAAAAAAEAARAAAAATRSERATPYERSRDGRRDNRGDRNNAYGNKKPGDWTCPECEANNFASRGACYQCGAAAPPGAGRAAGAQQFAPRPGDWACSCGASNFAWRDACYTCGAERPEGAARVPTPRGGGDRYGNDRFANDRPPRREGPGDWFCGEDGCGAHNFRRRSSCFLCGAPRGPTARVVPGDPGANDRYGGGGERRGPPEPREGDWGCPSCGFNNFASRTDCYRCGTPAPPGMGGRARPPRGEGGGWGGDRRGGGGGGGRGFRGGRGDRGGGDRWSSSPPPADEGLEW